MTPSSVWEWCKIFFSVSAGQQCGSPQLPLSLWPAGLRSDVCFRRRSLPSWDKLCLGPSCWSLTTGTLALASSLFQSSHVSLYFVLPTFPPFQAELWHPHHSHSRPIRIQIWKHPGPQEPFLQVTPFFFLTSHHLTIKPDVIFFTVTYRTQEFLLCIESTSFDPFVYL